MNWSMNWFRKILEKCVGKTAAAYIADEEPENGPEKSELTIATKSTDKVRIVIGVDELGDIGVDIFWQDIGLDSSLFIAQIIYSLSFSNLGEAALAGIEEMVETQEEMDFYNQICEFITEMVHEKMTDMREENNNADDPVVPPTEVFARFMKGREG